MMLKILMTAGFLMMTTTSLADEAPEQAAPEPGIYKKLGFKTGGEVRTINNEDVDSPAKAMELDNQLKASEDNSVTLDRPAPPVREEEP